jgi:hypothetical protein
MEEYDCISSDEEMEFPTDVEIISRSEWKWKQKKCLKS